MEKRMDYNSITNQRIKGDFVAREVKTCFSYEMEAILKIEGPHTFSNGLDIPTFEDVENLYLPKCTNCGYQGNFKVPDNGETFICPDCNTVFEEEPESEPQDIMEWWIVTDYLYNKLKDKGEAVLEWGNNHYWGRTCSGQAILLDGVISEICEEMEILAGQKYSWAEK